MLRRIIDFDAIRTWLDVGTGYGFLLQWLRNDQNINAEGVELSTQEAEYARNQLRVPVQSRLLSESELPRSSFDVVSSFEVIEHVPDPREFLAEMVKYVRPNGRLVIMTDNFESQAVIRLRGSFPKWIPHSHISHFAHSSLAKCIQSLKGLVLEASASYSPWDIVAREWLSYFRQPVPDELAYDLEATLEAEMHRDYRYFHLRYLLNPLWAMFSLRNNLSAGALMYAVCRRVC